MVRARARRVVGRVRQELQPVLGKEHSSRQVAGSFALGTFVTMLPTLGVGLLFFVVIAFVSDRVSKIALFASAVVFNPVVKWGVYVASFALGVVLLGPVEGVGLGDVSLDAGPEILVRLLVGNLVLAAAVTPVAFVAVHRIALAYENTSLGEVIEEAVEEIVDEFVEEDEEE